jgi:hypothetical protein
MWDDWDDIRGVDTSTLADMDRDIREEGEELAIEAQFPEGPARDAVMNRLRRRRSYDRQRAVLEHDLNVTGLTRDEIKRIQQEIHDLDREFSDVP